jgi:hypothetical protein
MNGEKMRVSVLGSTIAVLGMLLLFGNTPATKAQVKQVEMHIDGYLCGN